MLLNKLFKDAPEIEIKQISCDSRLPMKDCIFFCINGIKDNGHDYIDEAIKNGANVIVHSQDVDTSLNAIFIKVNDVSDVLNKIAATFYDEPSKYIDNYVIAGSYGRSSISMIINQLASETKKCASIGVNGIRYDNQILLNTTPTLPIIENQKYLDLFRKSNINLCTFEASALSLAYKKLNAVLPKCFVFSCTGEQSADYREMGRDYYEVIERYLYTLDNDTVFILNRDDISFNELAAACGQKVFSYGCRADSDYLINDIRLFKDRSHFILKYKDESYTVNSPLLSQANVYNLVAAIAALHQTGFDLSYLINNISNIKQLAGVYENVCDEYHVICDCADTLESIEQVLKFSRRITSSSRRIIVLFSINSDDNDDRLKALGKLASNYCDLCIFTEDDTYDGDISNVLPKIGNYLDNNINHLFIEDRKEAIRQGVDLVRKDDTLLLLGKGSEHFLYKAFSRINYEGDSLLANNYIKERLENNYESSEVY